MRFTWFWCSLFCWVGLANWVLGNENLTKHHLYDQEFLLSKQGGIDSLVLRSKDLFAQSKWRSVMRINNTIIGLYISSGKMEEALKYLCTNLSLGKKNKTAFTKELCYSYYYGGEVKFYFNDKDSANWYFNKSLELALALNDYEVLANLKIYEAAMAFNLGDVNNIKTKLEQSLDFIDKGNLRSNKIYYKTLNTFGIFYETRGDFEKANEYYQQTVKVYNGLTHYNTKDASHLAIFYNNIGASYYRKGDFDQAITYYHKSKFLLQQLGLEHEASFSRLTNNIGLSFYKSGNLEMCRESFLESLNNSKTPKTKKEAENFISACNHLASYYLMVEKPDSALVYLNKAIDRQAFFEYRQHITYWKLSDVFIEKKQWDKASMHAQKALQLCIKEFGENNTNVGEAYLKLGELYYAKQEFQTAAQFFNNALQVFSPNYKGGKIELSDIVKHVDLNLSILRLFHKRASTLFFLGISSKSQDVVNESFDNILIASNILDSLRLDYLEEGSKLNLAERAKLVYEDAIEICYELGKKDSAYFERVFQFFEKSKGTLLLHALKKQELINAISGNDSLFFQQKKVGLNIAFYKNELFKANKENKEKVKLYNHYLIENKLEAQRIDGLIKKKYKIHHQLKQNVNAVSIDMLRHKLLDEKTVLVAYFFGKKKLWTFSITSNDYQINHIELDSLIINNIDTFRNLITQFNGSGNRKVLSTFIKSGSELYQKLLAPSVGLLKGDINRLIILPDKKLWFLPFEVLPEVELGNTTYNYINMPYVLRKYSVSYGYSSHLLMFGGESVRKSKNQNCLAFAPFYGDSLSQEQLGGSLWSLRSGFSELPSTFNEIKAIGKNFNGKFYLGKTANKERFIKESSGFNIIHLALHGVADDKFPENSRLLFRSENGDSIESMYMHEMIDLNLNANLVVLSACETGLGKINDGEGVISMGRGFLQAGVPGIVTSLWKIPDKATSIIMKDFYKNLAQGLSKDESLRQAKLQYLNHSDELTSHPFFWAAFISLGNQSPIISSNYSLIIIIFLVFLGMLILMDITLLIRTKQKSPVLFRQG